MRNRLLAARRWFRVARPAGFAWNYTKTILQTTVLWAVFLFIVPVAIADIEDRWVDLPSFGQSRPWAVVGFVAFGALGLWGGVAIAREGEGTPLPLDSTRRLVVAGPYRFVRNPMAISAPGQAVSLSFWFDSTLVALYGVGAAVVWHVMIRPPEELDLEERFGPSYIRYRTEVRVWLPRRSGYDAVD